MATREEQRREYNEQKELESLRRVFDTLDKDKNNKIDFKEVCRPRSDAPDARQSEATGLWSPESRVHFAIGSREGRAPPSRVRASLVAQLNDMLIKLDYKAKRQEVEDMIWEVDEDCDKCVSWD
eukprot:805367-Prymnesium_polylepis.1